MIDPCGFYEALSDNGIDFFTGVPDSLLKCFCGYTADNAHPEKHIIAANEGGALSIAAGYHIATGKIPLVYMQNSGLGNIVNPLLSLADSEVYSIPMLIMIGWRGMPGVKDEPQHKKQGRVQNKLLEAMDTPYEILSPDTENIYALIKTLKEKAVNMSAPVALVVQPGTFEKYQLKCAPEKNYELTREAAIKEIIDIIGDEALVVSTTGKTSRELYEYREEKEEGHDKDFLTVGSMGHASQIALGIALNTNKQIVCLDGDGALLMHMGSLAVTGTVKPKNFIHILLNNGCHDSVGGQPTCGFDLSFTDIAASAGYNLALKAETADGLRGALGAALDTLGPSFIEVRLKRGSRSDLGRPKETPAENKKALMNYLKRDINSREDTY